MNLKARNSWTDSSLTKLFELLSDALHVDDTLPRSMYEAKKVLCLISLSYKKIHVYSNDCILYSNEYGELKSTLNVARQDKSEERQ